ncbi:MAG: O-antigen ligase family protein [Terriglobales bacterium]
MNPSAALLLFAAGILGLLYLDREGEAGVTPALWLPTLWLWINCSRAPSLWLGLGPVNPTPQQVMEGSPLDAAILGLLLLLALAIVWRRREQVKPILKLAWPILLYFGYCGLSTLWSTYTAISFKRWIKSWGDLAMVLVIATEPDVSAAVRRVFSRAAFVLLPASVLVIKYYPLIGRYYDPWSGEAYNQGVSITKNGLGAIVYVLGLVTVWQFVSVLQQERLPHRRRRLLAQLVTLAFAIGLLSQSHSATSGVAFALGAGLLVILAVPAFRHRAAVHAIVVGILLAGGLALWLGAEASVTHDLGRRANLTDRTVIWHAVLAQAAEKPLLGTGFESFWTGQNIQRVWARLPLGLDVNESHDGYIEVYAQLGAAGLAILAVLLVTAYRRAVTAFVRQPLPGGLLVPVVASVLVYNITEAGFRLLDVAWFALLLALVWACRLICEENAGAPSHPRPAAVSAPQVAW